MASSTTGYLYCMTNASMPSLLKIGMTERTPEERLRDANSHDTWRPPTPYVIEFAKQVQHPKQKEATLHRLLEQYTDRVHPRREFFRVGMEELRLFFDLMDGEYWVNEEEASSIDKSVDKIDDELSESDRVRLTGFLETYYSLTGKPDDKMKTKDVYLVYTVYDKSPEMLSEREFMRCVSRMLSKKGNFYLGLRPKSGASSDDSKESKESKILT